MKWTAILTTPPPSASPVSHVKARSATAMELVLVDDSEEDEILSIRALRKSGIRGKISSFRSGEDVLAHFAARLLANGTLPQLLLLDLKLPGRGGLDILRELRANDELRDLPVIILTGRGPDFGLPLGDYGPTVLVHKPLAAANIRSSLHALGLNDLLRTAA